MAIPYGFGNEYLEKKGLMVKCTKPTGCRKIITLKINHFIFYRIKNCPVLIYPLSGFVLFVSREDATTQREKEIGVALCVVTGV